MAIGGGGRGAVKVSCNTSKYTQTLGFIRAQCLRHFRPTGTLWVGRSRGDTLIVNVTPQTSEHACVYGQILAQLDADNVLGYANGRVDDIISTGANKVGL